MSASEHVSIAVDYYRLLQVPRVSRPDAIRKAYEALVQQPPATAYSADTLFARAVLLKAAAESLTDPDLRRSYDAKVAAGHGALRVSQQDLPGTLVVLQEIGEFQLVLEHGSRWLELNGAQPDASDVAAAVALAFCDRAGEQLAAPAANGAVLPACDDLDAALVKLRRYGVAKQLQTQIVGALRDLAPEYACELAALPLGPETSARRAKGVALMRGVLRSAASLLGPRGEGTGGAVAAAVAVEVDGAESLGDDDPHSVVGHARRMLQRGRDVLTCGEQVSLLPDALRGSGATPHPDVLYDGALACIVDGYRNGWPHYVRQADALLQQLEEHLQRQAAAGQREKQDPAAAAAVKRVQYGGAAAAAAPGGHHYDGDGDAAGAADGAAVAGGGGGEGGSHSGGVALERAVCAILRGDYAAAVALLWLTTEGGAPAEGTAAAADAQLRSFVMEHAPSGTQDMRPGLRALATKWLEGVALASFRDTVGQPVMPLETSWFADPRVATYLQVWRMCPSEQVLAAAHLVCNLLPNLLSVLTAFATKVATMVALVASRTQRIAGALAALATSSSSSSSRQRAGVSGAPQPRRSPPPGTGPSAGPSSRPALAANSSGNGGGAAPASTTPPAAAAAAMAVAAEAATPVGMAGSSVAVPSRPHPAATPSPFGHPNGSTLRDAAAVSSSSAAAAAASPADGVSARPVPYTKEPVEPRVSRRSTDMGCGPGTAAAAAATAAAAVGVGAGDAAAASSDLRRRFAAIASVDTAEGIAAARDANGGLQPHHVDEDEHHGDGTAEDELHELDDTHTPVPRRGMTEQDLRAHLAGLEAAMWDSEVPGSRPAPQRLVTLAFGVAAMLAGLFFFVFMRNGGSNAAARAPASAPPPAVVSITVSAFVSPN
ncbi:hypothetical protein PLESTB_000899900 [Pleodorina starrii]|uniref:J domain-containing protein n=1 Tax=Pleodorina starrii TaxID=330485 RepID=A0A9W6BMK1_9CHLO|nr:hypothetical protein PLESTB_000899900 [Pleodorina starrii]GLC68330.1 hypothetical protein PLESTF_000679800 [Pleodorina starrii]